MPKQTSPRCSHLASHTIDENGPGSILIDFEVLLGFVEDGVRSTGKHHLLPMARLFELDQLMTKPLRPRLQRPQQKSFPNLNGLYLLLRATQLGVAEVRRTPFGDELLQTVFNEIERELFARDKRAVEFGAWQPVLRSYFPQWVNNLTIAEPEFRDGTYYFKVSLGEPWRRIAIPAKSDLDDLAECIIRAFDFDGDHLYGFQFVARDGRQIRVEHPEIDDAEAHTDELAIGELPLNERQSMQFQYDFGANWQFDVQLETIDHEGPRRSNPTIVESRGEAPVEYESDDDW